MCLKGIKLVTFDATNTLLKFIRPPWNHYALVARENGFEGTSDDVKDRLLKSYKVMWDKHPNFGRKDISWESWWRHVVKLTFEGQLPATADIEGLATRLINEFKTTKCWTPAEGSERLVRLLRYSGHSVGVISNFDPRLKEILHNVNINLFDFILTSYEIGYSKPDARVFNYVLKKSSIPLVPSECLHIGDDFENDYIGAKSAGWHALLVSKKKRHESRADTKHVFHSLEDLCSAIDNKTLNL